MIIQSGRIRAEGAGVMITAIIDGSRECFDHLLRTGRTFHGCIHFRSSQQPNTITQENLRDSQHAPHIQNPDFN